MATSKCGHCGGHDFELKTIMPTGAAHPVEVVQCSACGAVMGTLQTAEIDQVSALAGRIDAGLRAVVEALNRR